MVGVVNLSIDTFNVPPLGAVIIVAAYIGVVNTIALILYRYNKHPLRF